MLIVLVEPEAKVTVTVVVVTVRVVVAVSDESAVEVAVMVLVPVVDLAVASPLASIVATVLSLDCQVALTLLLVVLSLFTPFAVNCRVPPSTTLGLLGLMLIDFRTGLVKKPRHDAEIASKAASSTARANRQESERFFSIDFSSTLRPVVTLPAQLSP